MSECGERVERGSYFLGPCVEPAGHDGFHTPAHNWAWYEEERIARCQRCGLGSDWPDEWRYYPRDEPPVIVMSRGEKTQNSGLTE